MIEPTPPFTFGLTTLGVIHTIISLLALAAGVVAFVRDGRISRENSMENSTWSPLSLCVLPDLEFFNTVDSGNLMYSVYSH